MQAAGTVSDFATDNPSRQQQVAGFAKDFAASLLLEPLLTVREVARLWGVCTRTVYGMIERGELQHLRVSNSIRVRAEEIKRLASPRW